VHCVLERKKQMKLLKKLFKKKLTRDQIVMVQLNDNIKGVENHLIAIARLQFIKPEALVREASNTKANAKYLLELIKIKEKK